jgi:proteic killer suppression protein
MHGATLTPRNYHLTFNAQCYIIPTIKSFADKTTEALFEGLYVRSLPPHIQPGVHRKLLMIDAAASVQDLMAPPGNRLEVLNGSRSGQWSIRLNQQWRICFYFIGDEVFGVEIVDYH